MEAPHPGKPESHVIDCRLDGHQSADGGGYNLIVNITRGSLSPLFYFICHHLSEFKAQSGAEI